jgi:Uma2 family endonuclease
MAELGVLAPDARVELIKGEIVDMAPMGPRHGSRINYLDRLFTRAVGERALVRSQLPIQLGEHSEPEPDLALVKPRADFYGNAHPTAEDTLLLVEVSDSTLEYDSTVKIPLYAAHGIVEVWIVDLNARVLHIHRSPAQDHYAQTSSTHAPGTLAVGALPGFDIDLTHLFGL